jgi:inosose dehydratase
VTVPRLWPGSCPDSWGVWFADDPRQTPWRRFLGELAGVGYEWLELGPYGYLPTDPAQLGDELAGRGLRVSGGTMHGFSGLHRAGDFAEIVETRPQIDRLLAETDPGPIAERTRAYLRACGIGGAQEAPDGKEEPS